MTLAPIVNVMKPFPHNGCYVEISWSVWQCQEYLS